MSAAAARRCPACGGSLDRLRFAAARVELGCPACGKWFAGGRPVQGGRGGGSPVLGKPSIALGLSAGDLQEAAAELLPRALHGAGPIFARREELASAVREGGLPLESEARRGLALLRLVVEELPEPRAALGVFPKGVEGPAEESVFVALLWLAPAEGGADLAKAVAGLAEGKIPHLLRTAESVEAVLDAFAGSEK